MIAAVSDILSTTPCISSNRSEPLLTPVVDLQPGLHQGQGDGPLHQGADLHDRLSSWHTHVMASTCDSRSLPFKLFLLSTGDSLRNLASLFIVGIDTFMPHFFVLRKN